MGSEHRIPLSEERRNELRDLKAGGQSYDELLAEMIQHEKERRLSEMFDQSLEEDEFVPLEDV